MRIVATRQRMPLVRVRVQPDVTVDIDGISRLTGLHPDLVRRFVRLGLLEPVGGTAAAPVFAPEAAAALSRAQRLRRDLALSYAGAVLATELLARIEELEDRLARYEPRSNHPR
jgi:hypothetical protein